jgi:tetratricopeptide (TPR) repeat protein
MKDNYELSPLGLKYRAELPDILRASDNDLDAAIAALDRYLEQAPPPAFQKALLTWKGRFYVEYQRYDDAVRVLREADALQGESDMQSFCTRSDLAKALEGMGNPQEAYAVLIAALEEIDELDLLIKLLRDVAGVASNSGLPVPPRAEDVLNRVKELYGVDESPSAGVAAEMVHVADVLAARR